MIKSEIKPGEEYALREKRAPGSPLQRIRVLEHVRGNRWKAEWIDPNPGLVHYIESSHLIAPWKGLKAFLKEEASALAIREHNERHGYEGDSPLEDALHEVFENTGGEVNYYRGILSGSPEAIGRLKVRARMDPDKQSPVAYVDRSGSIYLPFDEAIELARLFCAAEPAVVLLDIETTERKWSQEATHLGEDYKVGLINRYRAAWALIRQWAGQDAAIAQREAQIQRLERLVWDAVYALQKAGLDAEAAKLRRRLEVAT